MLRKIILILAAAAFFFTSLSAFAVHEIQIDSVFLEQKTQERYLVGGSLLNQTDEPREVTIRAQIFFYEKGVPAHEKPAMILRKDATIVLKKRERRKIRVLLLNEGTFPKERLRAEPEIRVRRQREWHY